VQAPGHIQAPVDVLRETSLRGQPTCQHHDGIEGSMLQVRLCNGRVLCLRNDAVAAAPSFLLLLVLTPSWPPFPSGAVGCRTSRTAAKGCAGQELDWSWRCCNSKLHSPEVACPSSAVGPARGGHNCGMESRFGLGLAADFQTSSRPPAVAVLLQTTAEELAAGHAGCCVLVAQHA